MQARGIRSINTMSSDAISLAPLNLDADSMAPVRRPCRRCYWARDQRPTPIIDGEGRALSFDTSFATNAKAHVGLEPHEEHHLTGA